MKNVLKGLGYVLVLLGSFLAGSQLFPAAPVVGAATKAAGEALIEHVDQLPELAAEIVEDGADQE